MLRRFQPAGLKPGLASLAVLLGGGCAASVFSYEVTRYGTVAPVQMHLACRDTYEVYDRPDAGSLLVVTNALNESLSGLCGEGAAILPREQRMHRIAGLFLTETTDRPACRIVRERVLAPLQSEFDYVCPAPPPVGATRATASTSGNGRTKATGTATRQR